MFALLLMLADPASTGTVTVTSGPLNIPDEIAPAVMPYMACLTAAKGSPLRNGPSGPEFMPGRFKVGQDCSLVRTEAAQNSDRLLRGSTSKKGRAKLIETTLSSIDGFVGSLPALVK